MTIEEHIKNYTENDPDDFECYFIDAKVNAKDFTLVLVSILKNPTHNLFKHTCELLPEFHQIQGPMLNPKWIEVITKYGRQYNLLDCVFEAMKMAKGDNLGKLIDTVGTAMSSSLVMEGYSWEYCGDLNTGMYKKSESRLWWGNELHVGKPEIDKIIEKEMVLLHLSDGNLFDHEWSNELAYILRNIQQYKALQ